MFHKSLNKTHFTDIFQELFETFIRNYYNFLDIVIAPVEQHTS